MQLRRRHQLKVSSKDYPTIAADAGIELVTFPVIEGGVGQGGMEATHAVLAAAHNEVALRGGRAVLHCRGGVGRAGMLAACFLLLAKVCKGAQKAIKHVREKRCKQAVETRRQEDFVAAYRKWLLSNAGPQEEPVVAAAAKGSCGGSRSSSGGGSSDASGGSTIVRLQVRNETKVQPQLRKVRGSASAAADASASPTRIPQPRSMTHPPQVPSEKGR